MAITLERAGNDGACQGRVRFGSHVVRMPEHRGDSIAVAGDVSAEVESRLRVLPLELTVVAADREEFSSELINIAPNIAD